MSEARPFGKWIDFDENGLPVPRYTKPMPVKQVQDIFSSGLALTYEPATDENGDLLPGEEELKGLTIAEVIVYRQLKNAASPKIAPEDSLKAANFIIDRVLGKPKQTNEVTQVNLSYAELLQKWIEEEEHEKENILALEARQKQQWAVIEFDKNGRPIQTQPLDVQPVSETNNKEVPNAEVRRLAEDV